MQNNVRASLKYAANLALSAATKEQMEKRHVQIDVFMNRDGSQYWRVPWKSRTERAVDVLELPNGAWVNATDIDDGPKAKEAIYAGCIAVDMTDEYTFSSGTA